MVDKDEEDEDDDDLDDLTPKMPLPKEDADDRLEKHLEMVKTQFLNSHLKVIEVEMTDGANYKIKIHMEQ